LKAKTEKNNTIGNGQVLLIFTKISAMQMNKKLKSKKIRFYATCGSTLFLFETIGLVPFTRVIFIKYLDAEHPI
jgi:hypothetical protein